MRPHKIAAIWLGIVSLILLGLAVRVTTGPFVNANLLELLPKADLDPVVSSAVRNVEKRFERQVVWLVGAQDQASAQAAAEYVHGQLVSSEAFHELHLHRGKDFTEQASAFYFRNRYSFMSARAQGQLTSGNVEAFESDVIRRYFDFNSIVTSEMIAQDPLLLVPDFLSERANQTVGKTVLTNGLLMVEGDGKHYAILNGSLAESPFSFSVQERLSPLHEEIRRVLPSRFPGGELLVAGVLPHATAGTKSAIDEMSTVGVLSLTGVIVLLVAIFWSWQPYLLSVLSILVGCLCGLAACLLVFNQVHLLTLVFGASLVGISVDYSLHFFCERFHLKTDWSPQAALRQIMPGITLGLITSVVGFAGLFLAPFPGMRELALFSSAGLAASFGCVVAWYPMLTGKVSLPKFQWPLVLAQKYEAMWKRIHTRHAVAGGGVLCIAFSIGCLQLTASDDVRLLQTPNPVVVAEEIRARVLIGRNLSSQFLLVEGKDVADFLNRTDRIAAQLKALQKEKVIDGYLAITDFVGSPNRNAEYKKLLQPHIIGKSGVLHNVANAVGLPEETREAYITDFLRQHTDHQGAIKSWMDNPASEPFRHLWLGSTERGVIGVIGLKGVYNLPPLQKLADGDKLVHFVDPAGQISHLFGEYRVQTIWLTLGSYLVVVLLLIFRYGIRNGLLVMTAPAIAAFASLAVLGYVGEPLSFFNIMGLLLVLGIGVDYSLFFKESGGDNPSTLLAIALSCFTTLLAFGLLAFSDTTAIHAFGLTILIGIFVAFVLSPLSGVLRPGAPTARPTRHT